MTGSQMGLRLSIKCWSSKLCPKEVTTDHRDISKDRWSITWYPNLYDLGQGGFSCILSHK